MEKNVDDHSAKCKKEKKKMEWVGYIEDTGIQELGEERSWYWEWGVQSPEPEA